ncbi:hypothetical protein LUQ84_001992 [Hamiltosporidium tvaerminnensis]|nr:hypothetical protein LUQ84_001992 [Hamiltosporidium tvaerminnensis]
MNATACEPANGMTNLITAAILKESRLMALHSILDSVIVESTNGPICSIAVQRDLRECAEKTNMQFRDTIIRNFSAH